MEKISELILDSVKEITSVLKTMGSTNRLKILAYLVDAPRNFAFILNRLKIKRTTLNHHIDLLIGASLIEKEEWGRYKITDDGLKFLKTITETYQHISLKQQREHQELINEYNQWPQFYREPRVINETIITNKALFQGGWNSYISGISGVLISLEVPYDYIYINGMTGYCFITCVPGIIKTSSIKEIIPKIAWEEIYKGTESFGWKLEKWEKKRVYPGKWNLIGEDIDLALKVFNNIVSIIEKYDTPVVLFGIQGTGFGIVNGYRNDSYLVSSYFRVEGREEEPIRFDQLRLLDKFIYYYFHKNVEKNDIRVEEKESINRAINFAEGSKYSQEGFTFGPLAFDLWMDLLESAKDDEIDIYGNSILGQYYYDCKYQGAEYLDRLSRKYRSSPQGDYLKNAYQEYRDAKMHLEKFIVLFPYFEPNNNSLSSENRKKGISILKDVKECEKRTIENLEKAYFNWQ
ncbi:MAG: hypothetical protein ACFFBP_18810 [Promethearchaeota archaeon]